MDAPSPLTPPEIARLIRSSTAAIEREVQAAPAPLLAFHHGEREWCIKEVLGHLIEADRRGFGGRVQLLLERDHPDLASWNQEEVAGERHDCEVDADQLLFELLSQRERYLELVAGLQPTDLSRSGRHPKVGELSVGDIITEWVYHDRNHLKQLLANVQAYVWPHLGAAQGFAGE